MAQGRDLLIWVGWHRVIKSVCSGWALPRKGIRHMRLASAGLLVLIAGMLPVVSANAQAGGAPKEMVLWPSGAPDTNGLSGSERGGNCVGNISKATMKVFLPSKEKATGAAVVITPGGGYGVVCLGSEGKAIADILVPRGIAAIVVKYRLPNGHHQIPANDARRAIRMVRHNAAAWNINPKKVGVWGFSAGGHLASTVSTTFDAGQRDHKDQIERRGSRPDFSILFYPVISMEAGTTHGGSRRNLIGAEPSEKLVKQYSREGKIGKSTPPTFILHCSDDRVVPVENSLRYYRKLIEHRIPAQFLIYEKGGHGPGAFKRNPSWLPAFENWLKRRGCL